jgi:selenocysteine lyase/cysteine desulfurase
MHEDAFGDFIGSHRAYKSTQLLDQWRETEYSRLDTHRQIYLDYTGGGLYSQSQLDDIFDQLDKAHHNLFVFPAQSNFSGVKHPLDLTERAHGKGLDVLLDAAAYVPSSRLDLSVVKPDFVTISFYKMFGYPTGIGALLIRRSVFKKLKRPWFAGGTVNFASVQGNGHYLSPNEAAFEDGTVNYLNIPAAFATPVPVKLLKA